MPNELHPATAWSSRTTRAQFAAVAWLRWRIFCNSFRRKGSTGELIARIIIYPIFAGFAIIPVAGAGFGAYFFASHDRLPRLAWLLWVTFALCQLLNIQLGQPGTTFDPTQLIRFPLRLRSYTLIRLFFGFLSPANIIGTLMALATAIGVSIAAPSLTAYAFLALGTFALANVLFTRMIFTWVDRWLSTRRAREVFTGIVFAVSLGIQWLNFTYNPAYNHNRANPHAAAQMSAAMEVVHRVEPLLAALPPETTSRALVFAAAHRPLVSLGAVCATAAFAAAFFAIFALRIKTEYRGENLSDAANGVASQPASATASKAQASSLFPTGRVRQDRALFGLKPQLAAVLGKELLYIRRTTGIFYGLIAPLVFVLLFAGKLASRAAGANWILPVATAYVLLGVLPMSYNAFGLDGPGTQFYFLAPVSFRDILIAKNLLTFLLAAIEVLTAAAIVTYSSAPPTPVMLLSVALWTVATLLLSTSLANRRSFSAPKKVNLVRASGKQASPLSALIAMGILLGSAVFGAAVYLGTQYLHLLWVMPLVFLLCAATAVLLYRRSLAGIDRFALDHRETLLLELSKQA